MVFSNLLFIYLFLPIFLIFYFSVQGNKKRNIVLLLFSIIFYTWANPAYLLLLFAMVLINYLSGMGIDRAKDEGGRKRSLTAGIFFSLLLLSIFKYTGFVLGTMRDITGFPKEIVNIALPAGISFYTFQLISYIVDVYRREAECERSYFGLLLYAGMFFQCIAGPIIRYTDVENEIRGREHRLADISSGIGRFAAGLAKKTLIANTCAKMVDSLVPEGTGFASVSVISLWLCMIAYAFQIYFDFSGYSDMAIGMGLICGFHFKENFNYPYISKSVRDFWKRWHISLSTFFRDYLYIPLGGNRKGSGRTVLNLFIVWSLTGLWHGASWNYVLWGIYFFIFILAEHLFLGEALDRIPSFISHIYAGLVILFGWVLFKYESMGDVAMVFKGMFGLNGNPFVSYEGVTVFLNYVFFLCLCVLASTPVIKKAKQRLKVKLSRFIQNRAAGMVIGAGAILFPTLLLVLSTMSLVGSSYNPFLYFQF